MKPARRALLAGICLGCLLAFGALFAWVTSEQDLGCQSLARERAKTICRHVGASMEFEWLGHAIVSPGYRVTYAGIRDVFCELKINPGDFPEIDELLQADDWRLQNAGDFLLRLVTGHDRYGTPETETSIFNATNPQYILQGGCKS